MAPTEQLVYLFREEKIPLFVSLSIASHAANRPKTAEASAEWLLNGKATGRGILAEQMQLGRRSDDPNVKRLVGELAKVREQLARLVLHPKDSPAATWGTEQTALRQKEQELARKLGLQTRTGSRLGVDLPDRRAQGNPPGIRVDRNRSLPRGRP